MNIARGAYELFKEVTIVPSSTGISEVDKMFHDAFNDLHAGSPFPIYSFVRIKMSFSELVNHLMTRMDMKLQEARGYALEVIEGPNQVIGLQDLSDDHGIFHPYVSIMTNSGAMLFFRQDECEKAGDCLADLERSDKDQ